MINGAWWTWRFVGPQPDTKSTMWDVKSHRCSPMQPRSGVTDRDKKTKQKKLLTCCKRWNKTATVCLIKHNPGFAMLFMWPDFEPAVRGRCKDKHARFAHRAKKRIKIRWTHTVFFFPHWHLRHCKNPPVSKLRKLSRAKEKKKMPFVLCQAHRGHVNLYFYSWCRLKLQIILPTHERDRNPINPPSK